jgi:hypothetical protein
MTPTIARDETPPMALPDSSRWHATPTPIERRLRDLLGEPLVRAPRPPDRVARAIIAARRLRETR